MIAIFVATAAYAATANINSNEDVGKNTAAYIGSQTFIKVNNPAPQNERANDKTAVTAKKLTAFHAITGNTRG